MNGINVNWAISKLDKFIGLSQPVGHGRGYSNPYVTVGTNETLIKLWGIVEQILNRVTPDWQSRPELPGNSINDWSPMYNAALRAREILVAEEEIRMNLGDNYPELSVSDMHPWIWDGASSLWKSGHFREAVEAAIKKLNAETQNKIGSRKRSETKLFQEVFSANSPKYDSPRLQLAPDDGSDSSKSKQEGALMFAKGIFSAIRNPLAHEADIEMTEQQALEYLAALSILARWVDESEVVVAS